MPFSLADNPFAVLSAVAAPAVLTNACSVLALGTGNRIARVVDRSRELIKLKSATAAGSADYIAYAKQLKQQRVRGRLLLRALRLFYTGLALFAMSALVAIIGSITVAYGVKFAFHVTGVIGLVVGGAAVLSVVAGCIMMVQETKLAIESLTNEHVAALGRDAD